MQFVPLGNPIIYAIVLNTKHGVKYPFKIEVWEEDPVINDKMLEHTLNLRLLNYKGWFY